MEKTEIYVIARIRSDFKQKFGIPRQSGLVEELRAEIVFEPTYRNIDALRGIEGFSHLWLIWEFSQAKRAQWSPTVRPPRLGGNQRLGVFATRSPFRPNPIGLSCVRFLGLRQSEEGPILQVAGADLMDGTPIYDIKPYLPYADSKPDAAGGFAAALTSYELEVEIPDELLKRIPQDKQKAVIGILKQDPRPSYQEDPERLYGMSFAGLNIKFYVKDRHLFVCAISRQAE